MYPFEWKQKGLKYLGIKLPPLVKDLYQDNYIPLLNRIKHDLNGYPINMYKNLQIVNLNAKPIENQLSLFSKLKVKDYQTKGIGSWALPGRLKKNKINICQWEAAPLIRL